MTFFIRGTDTDLKLSVFFLLQVENFQRSLLNIHQM